MSDDPKPSLVQCPPSLAPLFAKAEDIMGDFFAQTERKPEAGEITISDTRYLLVRTDSLSIELQEELRKTFGEVGAQQIRYKLARACGIRDARLFAERLGVKDPEMKLALGPVHFAHVGWASVNIYPESRPQPNEDYFLVYDHPFSFEAEAYLRNHLHSSDPVCFMNAGYSAGWCQESFGVELRAEEVTCRARGDEKCVFVMAHPKHFDRLKEEYLKQAGLR